MIEALILTALAMGVWAVNAAFAWLFGAARTRWGDLIAAEAREGRR